MVRDAVSKGVAIGKDASRLEGKVDASIAEGKTDMARLEGKVESEAETARLETRLTVRMYGGLIAISAFVIALIKLLP